MMRKPFFRDLSARDIQEKRCIKFYGTKGLVERLLRTSDAEYIQIERSIFPNAWFSFFKKDRDATSQMLKYGSYATLDSPKTIYESLEKTAHTPREIILQSIEAHLSQEEYNPLGYRWKSPTDEKYRYVSFATLGEAVRIFAYNECEGLIKVRIYAQTQDAQIRGGSILAQVPSRSRDEVYTIRIEPFYTYPQEKRWGRIWGIEDTYPEGIRPIHEVIKSMRMPQLQPGKDRPRKVHLFTPHAIAGLWKANQQAWMQGNHLPHYLNPFLMPSPLFQKIYEGLRDCVVVKSSCKEGYRCLHFSEISHLIGQAFALYGRKLARASHDRPLKNYFS
jgi:hypothetical protein